MFKKGKAKTEKAPVEDTTGASKTTEANEEVSKAIETNTVEDKDNAFNEVKSKEAEINETETKVDVSKFSLEELTALASEIESSLEVINKALNDKKREAELKAKAEEEKNDKRPVFTDDRGLKWRFKKTAPKTLNIDGKPKKLEDIIEDKEVMSELVYGNSNFVEQKYI